MMYDPACPSTENTSSSISFDHPLPYSMPSGGLQILIIGHKPKGTKDLIPFSIFNVGCLGKTHYFSDSLEIPIVVSRLCGTIPDVGEHCFSRCSWWSFMEWGVSRARQKRCNTLHQEFRKKQ